MNRLASRTRTEPLLRGLFDHAGMFPPAQKPLAEALRDAASFPARLARPGIVGADLVIAWKDWPDLTPAALAAAGFASPCTVALVGVPLAELGPALQAARTPPPRVRVASVEAHFDGSVPGLPAAPRGVALFIEPKWAAAEWREGLGTLCAGLKAHGLGLKFRCAGPTAVDRATLAAIVRTAADAGIPLKATQGLHHPVATTAHPHGFLALAAAVRLRQALGAPFRAVDACLAETDAQTFDLADGVAWRGHHVPADQLPHLAPFAIGSCSLTEPDDDLVTALGPPRGA